jgi:hypothetical protein
MLAAHIFTAAINPVLKGPRARGTAKVLLLFAPRHGSVRVGYPVQPICQVEQFLLDFRDPRLPR